MNIDKITKITKNIDKIKPILVIGSTGHLGSKVMINLLGKNRKIRILLRKGSKSPYVTNSLVETVYGDMLDTKSLDVAFRNVDSVITVAAGYTGRKKKDNFNTDIQGNKNLVDSAKKFKIRRFVFLSIVSCDKASKNVRHFYHKKLIEDYMKEQRINFVSIRAPAFLDQSTDYIHQNIQKNRYLAIGSSTTRWSYAYTPDIAEALVSSLDPILEIDGLTIDIGLDRPLNNNELKELIEHEIGYKLQKIVIPFFLIKTVGLIGSIFSNKIADMSNMFLFFKTGKYISDTTGQTKILKLEFKAEDVVRRYINELPLTIN